MACFEVLVSLSLSYTHTHTHTNTHTLPYTHTHTHSSHVSNLEGYQVDREKSLHMKEYTL